MKTPRELLLARHQSVNPQLDVLRQAVIQDLPAGASAKAHRWADFVRLLWQQLIQPQQRTWATLAAIWLILIAINLSQHEAASKYRVSHDPVALNINEQQRRLNELWADRTPAASSVEAEPPRKANPQPHTQTTFTHNA
ncbi:MAG TPA: hypothetical protein VF607_10380 [Verrucomicrobiae bacterium]